MRPWIVATALIMSVAQTAQAGANIAQIAASAAQLGAGILEPAPPKPGLKPEDSRNCCDGIKALKPTQYDWDRYLRAKGYVPAPPADGPKEFYGG